MKSSADAGHPHEKPHHPHWPLAASLALFVFVLGLLSVHDSATCIHVKTGAKIIAEGALPKVDPFSYGSAGSRWTTYSWLSDVLFAKLESFGGPRALVLLKSAIVGVAFAALLPISSGGPLLAAFVLSAGAVAAWAGLTETPAVFDLLFFSLFLRFLRPRHHFRWRDAAWAAGLTIAWVNLHGDSAVLALVFVALKAFKTSMRASIWERMGYWMMLVIVLIVFAWNPHGYRVLLSTFVDSESAAWRGSLLSPAGVFLVAGMASCWFTLQNEFVVTLMSASVLALSVTLPGLRPLGVLAACPVIALAVGHAISPLEETPKRIALWGAFSAVLLGLYLQFVTKSLSRRDGYGVFNLSGALRFLDDNRVAGRMFNEPVLGAELIGLTTRPVFCDRREALYTQAFRRDAENWGRMFHVLDAIYHFNYAIVSNRRSPDETRALDEDPEWTRAYSDERALVYLKRAR